MPRLAALVTARRTSWIVLLLGLLIGGLAIGGIGQAERDAAPTDTLPVGRDSTEGTALLDELPADDSSAAVLLFTREDGPIQGDLPALGELVASLGGPPGVQPAEDGTAALAVVEVPATTATQTAEEVGELREALTEGAPAGVTAQVTGPAGIEADLAGVFAGANTTLLLTTASVVAVLLLITYRSPILWVVPLVVVGVADQTAAVTATHVLALVGVPWDESTIGILSVLVFGAGTNYALLLVSRYRDELRRREDRREAMAIALRRTASAVGAAVTTVVLGLLALLLSVFPTTRGLGLACAVGVVVAAAFVLIVLPAALVQTDRWIFWPLVPRVGQQVLSEQRSLWRRVGDAVAARPAWYAAGTVLVLMAMAFGLTRVSLGLPTDEQFLERPEAIVAAERLAESFPAGTADPTVVVSRVGDGDEPAVAELAAVVEAVPGVGSVQPGAMEAGIAQLQVVLDAEPGSEEAAGTVAAVRDALPDDGQTHVTGGEAQTLDQLEAAGADRALVVPLVLVVVLLGLVALLRSVVAPVLLVVSVLGTYLASVGVSWWLFTGPLGFTGLDPTAPLLAFVFLVALGVDYNIFLITRTLEETEEHGTRSAVLRALGATGGVITSAGILLAAVFAVLGVLPLVVLAQIGVIICIGVLLDTLVVRTVLVPALVLLLGDRFWWPRRVGGGARPSGGAHRPEAVEAELVSRR